MCDRCPIRQRAFLRVSRAASVISTCLKGYAVLVVCVINLKDSIVQVLLVGQVIVGLEQLGCSNIGLRSSNVRFGK